MTDGTPTPLAEGGDPGDFTVDQVNDYLATLGPDDDAREYVLQLEREGQARVGILGKPDDNGNRPTDPAPEAVTVEQSEAAVQLGADEVDLVLLQHWTDKDGVAGDAGKAYGPGQPVTVPATTGVVLLGTRWARNADDEATDED